MISSNKNPSFVCRQYLECVKCIGGVPRKVVGDHGTDNVFVAAAQRFLTRFNVDWWNSFKYGKPISNQQIQGLWSSSRRFRTNFWKGFFRNLTETEMYNNTSNTESECQLYCFGELIQRDLDCFKTFWNSHRIRQQMNSNSLSRLAGQPDILYFTPDFVNFSVRD